MIAMANLDRRRHASPEQFLSLIREQQRGRLKVYLGFAPGVGKTYEMLQEGQRLKRQGVDVVIGIVETHGRAETAALIGELEQVPRRRIEYRGVVLEEMDLDAVLARRPTVALVDELAHTNAPGSRNAKRYQDVEELLRAGINVITTMNIQHLEESLRHDRAIHRRQGQGARARLHAGPGRPDRQRGRVRGGFAGALEERQSLSRRAHRTGADELLHRIEPDAAARTGVGGDRARCSTAAVRTAKAARKSVSERVMVCLSSRSPNVHFLLRKAARLADRFNAPWYAVYIRTPQETLEKIDAATQRAIADALTLAQQLGGVSMPYQGPTFRRRWRSSCASTASRTCWWAGRSGRGIAAGSANRRWTGCCWRCRMSMSWSSAVVELQRHERGDIPHQRTNGT